MLDIFSGTSAGKEADDECKEERCRENNNECYKSAYETTEEQERDEAIGATPATTCTFITVAARDDAGEK